jgi:hypothetical protein
VIGRVRRALAIGVVAGIAAACGGNATPSPPGASPPVPAEPACVELDTAFDLPTNVFSDVELGFADTFDEIRFVFGPSISSPGGRPTATFVALEPPFTMAASGEEIDVAGANHVELRMQNMVLADASGASAYTGERRIVTEPPGVRELVLTDEFEGHVNWLIGFDGPCLETVADPPPGVLAVRAAGFGDSAAAITFGGPPPGAGEE